MTPNRCPRCGEILPQGAAQCPHCGAARKKSAPLALVAAFFIIGVLLGVLFIDSDYYPSLRQGLTAVVGENDTQPPVEEAVQQPSPQEKRAVVSALPVQSADESETALVCNREMARKIRAKALEIAEISESDGVLNVRMRQQWAYYTPGIRRSFLEAFAESDACLEGGSRRIHFFYGGEMFARSIPPEELQGEE
ncbi:MAG: zinc ribbon domain-containing protein [Gammaproteobacteria bacterium]|nr:zinc ribbon domain-containing protein [Gammaproteobacteria bacterium]